MNDLNKELVNYIENNVFPNYQKNDKGHQIEHINYVIERSFELSKDLNIDKNMVYTIASYHDCGCYIDRKNHEKISAKMMSKDAKLRKFFSEEEISIMKEAIEDHRASSKNEPRSIYGKIVSSADRNVDINVFLKRIYGHTLKHFPNYTQNDHIEYAYNHTKEKFGPNGYAKMYLIDKLYEGYLKEVANLISNKKIFVERFKELNNI